MNHSFDLGGKWSFAYTMQKCGFDLRSPGDVRASGLQIYPCQVPGNFETDLLANGLIGDPFYGMNIAGLTKYEAAHVYYFRQFEGEDRPGFEPYLVFDGLDCFADVYLNGQQIGSSDNMLVEHGFGVDGLLRESNELLVHIKPAVDEARKYLYRPGLLPNGNNYESLFVRKAPHMYGWDIMPRAVSAGIWRPVKLVYKPVERIDSVYLEPLKVEDDGSRATLALNYRLRTDAIADYGAYELHMEGCCGDSTFAIVAHVRFDAGRSVFHLENPALWWPRGQGDANLYDVTVTLLKDGVEIDRSSFTHGIRMVELLRTDVTDEQGSGEFCFKINGRRVFILGTNWVPMDAYHSRDLERIPDALALVEDIGCNMVRCWGGNVYENDLFFQRCDEKGIMVWQDFAMACAIYPQDEAFCHGIQLEARKVVQRLRQHPSLVLWCGDNECDALYSAWGGRRDPSTNLLTRQVLPRVLAEEDPSRPYLPSSPYFSPEGHRLGEKHLPEDHLWGPRGYFKADFYTQTNAHFVSEIGYHGCPSPESLRRFISPGKLWPYQDNEEWILHSTSPVPGVDLYDYRVELMASQVRVLFGTVPDNLDDFAFASQAVQGEADKFFIEFFRSGKWRRTGIIWWNILDGWPQLSDAVVDYYFAKKLAYDFIKRSQSPLCLIVNEKHELVAANDTRSDISIDYTVSDAESGEVLLSGSGGSVADSVTVLGKVPITGEGQGICLIKWESAAGVGWNHYLYGSPPFDLADYRRWLSELCA